MQQQNEFSTKYKVRDKKTWGKWARQSFIIIIPIAIVIGTAIWIISGQGAIATGVSIIFTALGLFLSFLQIFNSARDHASKDSASSKPIVIHLPPSLTSLDPPASGEVPMVQLITSALPATAATAISSPPPTASPSESSIGKTIDWGEAPTAGHFYGRNKELETAKRWIQDNDCQLVLFFGIGGIGKSTLAVMVAEQLKDQFEFVLWRSLQNAPPLNTLLDQCILFFSHQQNIDLSKNLYEKISMLINYFQMHRCLLVLDNLETMLRGGDATGQYREGYEEYGLLFQRIGEVKHSSCLLLTSREKPKEVVRLEGKNARTRVLYLPSMSVAEGREMLKDTNLVGTNETWAALIQLYSGNPLYLKLITEPIEEVFGGDISNFLKEGKILLGDIRDPLNWHFERLSQLEREIMYWLALEREPVSLSIIREDLIGAISSEAVFDAVAALRRRSLLDKGEDAQFTLQPVIMEYVTNSIVELFYNEITGETIKLLGRFSMIKARAKDYVRESQLRVIVQPLVKKLLTSVGKERCEGMLRNILHLLRESQPQEAEYAAGNVINLLVQLASELDQFDFSYLTVWRAYLHGVDLHDVNFSYAQIAQSVFTETFGLLLAVKLSPDGKLLAAGCDTHDIWLWETDSGLPLQTYHGHTGWVPALAFSPDGKLLASGSEDRTIRIWDVEAHLCRAILRGHTHRICGVAFSPDGRLLTSASHDKTIRLWDVHSGQCVKTFEETSRVWCVAYSPGGKLLAAGSDGHIVGIWDIDTGKCIRRLQEHMDWVRAIAFSSDGKLLASGSDDATIKIWNTQTWDCLITLSGHTNPVRSLAFGPGGTRLASCADDCTVRLWDLTSGQCLRTMQDHEKLAWLWSIDFSPDGQFIVSGSEDQTVRFWDVKTGRCSRSLHGYSLHLQSIAFSGDGRWLASGGIDELVRIWSIPEHRLVHTCRGHKGWVRAVDVSSDGTVVASGGEDRIVRLWDSSSGRCLKLLHGHSDMIWGLAFSPDDKVVASGSEDRTIRLWDISTGQCLKSIETNENLAWVWAIAVSPDGQLLASGHADCTVRIWETQSGQLLKTLSGHPSRLKGVSFSPDGLFLASSCEGHMIRVWEVNTGKCLLEIVDQGFHPVNSVSFSPDGTFLASGSDAVRLWDVRTGQCLKVLEGHLDQVRSVRFSATEPVLASASCDGTIRLWDYMNGTCLHIFHCDRPYERMNITNVRGLTELQRSMLKALGAIENAGVVKRDN